MNHYVIELGAKVLAGDVASRDYGDIFEHILAAIAEARALTAAIFSPHGSLFTTTVAGASPSTPAQDLSRLRGGVL